VSAAGIAAVVAATGVAAFGLSLLVRRFLPGMQALDPAPWSASLSYVAAAYGVLIGFSIVFLFGEFSNSRQAIGDEATSIGTAFDEILLFPEDAPEVQHALICYSRGVAEREWPALADGESAPEVDQAYKDLILALGDVEEPADDTFQPAAATNIFLQVGNISTARETRLVTAEVHSALWSLIFGGGALVVGILFVASGRAHPLAQATLVGLATGFTAIMIVIVFALSSPYAQGAGRLTPELIEQNTGYMEAEAPDVAALPCDFD
jgi:hypothetical protein